MQVPVEFPPQLAPWNEPWFRDKPVPLAKPTPSLFPADEEQLANVLDCELNGARKWDVSKLLEHMFSDEVLGLPVRKFTFWIAQALTAEHPDHRVRTCDT